MHAAYSLAVIVLAVVLSPWFAYQAIRYRKYIGSLGQRMGYLPVSFNLDGDDSIWIHAVSVGEALTARALIADLRERYPGLRSRERGCPISMPCSSFRSTFRRSSIGR